MKVLKNLQKVFIILLIILFLLIVIPTTYMFFAKTITNKFQPTIFGYASAIVVSGSMSGTIEINDYVITKTQTEYKVNDIVMFVSQNETSLITHRIIAITEEGIQTKGDTNDTADYFTTHNDKIVGKVVKIIPNIGQIFSFLISPIGMLCVFGVGFVVIEGPYMIKKIIKKREEKVGENKG